MSIAPTASMRTVFTAMSFVGLTMVASTLFPATASADRLQRCAREGGICRLPYPAEVVFGAQGRTTSRFFDRNAVPCSNRVFGDPAPGRAKACYIVLRDRNESSDDDYDEPPRRERWVPCADEGEFCDFYGRKVVRYGARGRFTQDVFRNGVQCDNDSFGDPAPDAGKRCYVKQ
ncbi:MAG: hypothetical protein E5V49_01740 [Mesorhizobium sp.]|nr:hypothetical protein EN848_07380 [bacterium M00.F.Ca.ET.205.01.1.1]TGU53876.1 hypothetical protein EN795_11805 [bacterium M00.F.Ca.ET.152.01.1.1]TGV37374.1 hypothetical protein EN829_011830 [Mesorhizobium sp. M00.F.Ca.ET.186.01.1.1]TGZ41266.1 hypothetical protein EN805_21020 [bacterium M00.F.Ca.ET.162.01.1.1]TIW62261.1 MAG: hypothetical protein E5V48_05760 [Mesorhizobium sp.]